MATGQATHFDAVLKSPAFDVDPYPTYHAMRAKAPVYRSEVWRCWVLTRYDDIRTAYNDPKRFSNVGRITGALQRNYPPEHLARIAPMVRHYSGGLINVDPPDHTRLRKLVQSTFQPRMLEQLRPRIAAITHELLDAVQTTGRMDVIWDMAYPLPITVIAELLGVAKSQRDNFKKWSSSIMEFMAAPVVPIEVAERSQASLMAMRDYLKSVCDDRRTNPTGDLISLLTHAEVDGDRLTESEVLGTCVSILIGGHETTTNLLSSAIYWLLRHPQQLADLRGDHALMTSAVEEVLRYESPFQRDVRVATEDVTLRDQSIHAGESVMFLLGAADRDPQVFDDPDRFDIRRSPNKHMAFGHGVHFCLGAALSRLEADVCLNIVLDRLPNLALDTDHFEWHNGVLRGLKHLPVRF